MDNECCANCKYMHVMNHNYTGRKGFQESYCCDVLMHRPEEDTSAPIYETMPEDKCEFFVNKLNTERENRNDRKL